MVGDDLLQTLDAIFSEGGDAVLINAVDVQAAVLGDMLIERSCSQSSSSPSNLATWLMVKTAEMAAGGQHVEDRVQDLTLIGSALWRQMRRMTETIKRKMRRRSAVEPVIGHLKAEHRMGRNHLAHAAGDAINAVLAAAGYNFRRLLSWLAFWLARLLHTLRANQALQSA